MQQTRGPSWRPLELVCGRAIYLPKERLWEVGPGRQAGWAGWLAGCEVPGTLSHMGARRR